MKKLNLLFLFTLFFLSAIMVTPGFADSVDKSGELGNDSKEQPSLVSQDSDHLVILWTSGDKEVAIKMVFMYAFNAKKYEWWQEITFIVWGPSSKLSAEDSDIQDYLKKMLDEGIVIKACKACADSYGVADTLASLGIEVKYMGQDLTDFIKSGTKLITF